MNILIFGVTNVGKTTIGKIIAEKLQIDFYDLDEEIKSKYQTTLEVFVNTGTLEERDKKRGSVIRSLLKKKENKVIAISPMSYPEYFEKYIRREDVKAIELKDTAENIFERLVFSDENDCIYTDNEYKNAHKNYYLNEITQDLLWYGKIYKNVMNKYSIDNQLPDMAAENIIHKFCLKQFCFGEKYDRKQSK